MIDIRIQAIIYVTAIAVGLGTVFFRFVEGWHWIDAYYFSVVTMTTVGYGDFVPVTVPGKIGATVMIFCGIGIIAAAAQQVGTRIVEARVRVLRSKTTR